MGIIVSPKELRINVGESCNRSCLGCSKDSDKERIGKPATLDDFFMAISETKEQGTLESASITGGEPLHPQLREKTCRLIEYAKPADVRLCTNGDFIDSKQFAEELKNLGVNSVQIGLDSSAPCFQNMRSKSETAWNDTMQGITNALKAGLPVSIRYTLYDENLDDAVKTYLLVSRMGVQQFKLRTLFPSGSAIQNCLNMLPSGEQLAKAQHDALLVSKGNATRLELSQPCFYTIPQGYNAFIEDNESCGERNNASINSVGIAEYCLFCDDGARFGNIKDNSFLDLWNSPEIIAARKQRKRNGIIVGCPAYEIQRQRHLGDYATFERELKRTTEGLQRNL
ncbi:radical SAM protein [Candidatus Woesearchaeota archaeon]|nr:radical SAM protein [Candidatus Woesearchaeota archaeon]